MGFGFGGMGMRMGPRGIIDRFGEEREGAFFDKKVIAGLLEFLKPYWLQLLLASLAMLASSGFTLLTPYLMKIAIDQNIAVGDLNGLGWTAFWLAVAFTATYAVTAIQRYLLGWVGHRVLTNVREKMFRHLQVQSLDYHDTHIVGVTVSRVINDVGVINDLLSQGLVSLLSDIFLLIGIMVIMLSMDMKLALLTFLVIPLMVLATRIFSMNAKTAFRQTRSAVAAVVGDLAEDISGMRVIQAFAQEKASQKKFGKVNDAHRQANINAMSLSFIFLPSIEFLSMLSTVIVLFFGGMAVVNGEVTLGVLVAFLSYVTRFFRPIEELSRMYTTMQSAMAGGEQVLALLASVPSVVDAPDAREMPLIQGKVEFRNVSFAYRKDTPEVLHNINLTVEPGQTVALVGPTGAGKTSITSLTARFYEVTAGAVLVDGIDIRQVTQQSLRRQMGVVTQDAFLFTGTIAENIRFSCLDASDQAVEQAARLANAHDFIKRLPDGYQTRVQEGAVNLSGGQRQLICIARAALANPRILILDEATANIDTMTERLIQQALERFLAGRTAIVVAHRLSTIRNADLICVIDNGEIVERGTHDELLARRGLYHDLYNNQFSVVET